MAAGGMRERPNRTVSKTVVSLWHRGFKSHSLRHPDRTRAPERRVRSWWAINWRSAPTQHTLMIPAICAEIVAPLIHAYHDLRIYRGCVGFSYCEQGIS